MREQHNGASLTSDNNGNLQTYSGWTFTYDAQNRLTNAFLPGSKGGPNTNLDFYYDAKNRQIARNVNGAITFSVWDDWELVEEYGTGNVVTAKYLQGAHGPVKSLLNAVYYYQDSLGSTSHVASSTGVLLEYYKYDLYGKPTYWDAGGNQISASNPTYNVRDLFSGERWISEMSIYDLRNRFYSPDLGRFAQPDPIGFKGDASNFYRYCKNDWANKTDPTGLVTSGDPVRDKIAQGTSDKLAEWEKEFEVCVEAHSVELHDYARTEARGTGENSSGTMFGGGGRPMAYIGTNECPKEFAAAREYLKGTPLGEYIEWGVKDPNYRIDIIRSHGTKQTDFFTATRTSATIHWNPYAGTQFKGGGGQSPALVLGHEFDHAHRAATDFNGFLRDTGPGSGVTAYGNREEMRVITGSETRTAKMLKETTRRDGWGRLSPVFSVTDHDP